MKTLYKLFIITFVAGLLVLPISCSEQLDINTNPLSASTADPNAILPFVIVQNSTRKTTEIATRMIDVWQNASVTFNSPRGGGNAAGGFLSGNYWGMLYTLGLSNLDLVERDARAAGPTNNNVAAIAVILKSLLFYDITSCWEEAPFTEALNATEFPSPNFDDQETILFGIVDMLDDAIALIDAIPATNNFDVSRGDLIYGGNMANWRAFANSLKIRILMMIRNQDTSVDAQLVSALAQPVIATNSQATMLRYSGASGNVNTWKQIVTAFGTGSNETSEFFGPSPLLRGLLEGDPRLALWCVDGTDGNFKAEDIGTFPDASGARFSDNLIRGNLPDIYFQPAEISFYKAELIVNGVIGGDANAEFRQGVRQSLLLWGGEIPGAVQTLTATQINDFLATLPDLATLGSDAERLELIWEQLYLAHFWWPIESWNTVRRTKVPDVQAAPGSTITTMLKRLQWSPTEVAANPNNPEQGLTDVPMWFEN